MLGIFKMAMPSNEMLLRFRVIPSRYKIHGKKLRLKRGVYVQYAVYLNENDYTVNESINQ